VAKGEPWAKSASVPVKKLAFTMGVSFFVGIVCICVDCGAGTTRYFECSVAAHHYEPAWTQITTSTDSNGNTSVDTVDHPEEFHLICQQLQGVETFDVSSSRAKYYTITNDECVTVAVRVGRWTGAHYCPRIDSP
jgi:hypothetical protein